MGDQKDLWSEAKFQMFADDDGHRSLFEAFVSHTRIDLGPIDKDWFYKDRTTQMSMTSDSSRSGTVAVVASQPTSQQTSNSVGTDGATRKSTASDCLEPYASTLEWTPFSPTVSDIFKTPAVPSTRTLLHDLRASAAGPSPNWSPSLETPPNRRSCSRRDSNVLAPRNLFYSSEREARSLSSELDDTLEDDFQDVLSDNEDERCERWQSSEFTDCIPPQLSRAKADGGCLPVEAIALCIQRSSQDEKELMEILNGPKHSNGSGESPKEHTKGVVDSSSTSQHLADNREVEGADIADGRRRHKSNAVISHGNSHISTFQSCARTKQEARDVVGSFHLEKAMSLKTAVAKSRDIVMRQKVSEANLQGGCGIKKSSRVVRKGEESVKEGFCSDESRMDYAFAKSQNEFLKTEYSLTQMFEVAESTLACLEAPDVGFSQSESLETGLSSEDVLTCLVDGEKSKRPKQVEAKMSVSRMASRYSAAPQNMSETSISDAASANPQKESVPDVMAAFFNPVKTEDVDKPIIKPSTFSTGFTTGSGKSVMVSAESLNAARHLLSGTEPHKHDHNQGNSAFSEESDKPTIKLVVSSIACATSGRTISVDSISTGFTIAGRRLVTVGTSTLATAKKVLQCELNPCSTVKERYSLEELQDRQHCPEPCSTGNKLRISARFEPSVDIAHQGNKSCASSAPAESDRITAGYRIGAGPAMSVHGPSSSAQMKPLFEDLTAGEKFVKLEEAVKVETGFVAGGGQKVPVTAMSHSSAQRFLDCPNSELHGAKPLATPNGSPQFTKDACSRQVSPQNNFGPNNSGLIRKNVSLAGFVESRKSIGIWEDSLNSTQKQFLSGNCKDAFRRVSTSFTTGSGKAVSISADSLKKVEASLNEAEISHNGSIVLGSCDTYKETLAGTSPQISTAPFGTASEKVTSASTDSLMKVEAFLNEAEKTCNAGALPCEHIDVPNTLGHCLPVTTCSAYGSGKQISADSLQKVEAFLSEAGKACRSDAVTREDFTLPGRLDLRSHSVATCFTTGSGTAVSVSVNSLQKARTFLGDTENVHKRDAISPENGDAPGMLVRCPQSVAICLTTGSGKAVSMSSDSLCKVEAFLSDAEKAHNSDTATLGNCDAPKTFSPQSVATCFTTCTGKAISVSAKSLREVEALLNEAGKTCNNEAVLLNRGSSRALLPNCTEGFSEGARQVFGQGQENGANHQTDFAVGPVVTLTASMDECSNVENTAKHDQNEVPCPNLSGDMRTSKSDQAVSTSVACSRKLTSLPSGSLNDASKIFREGADDLNQESADKSVRMSTQAKLLQVNSTTPGFSGGILEIQKTPQAISAMFKSKLKPAPRTPTFVTPFKAVGVGASRTPTSSKASNTPPYSLFRKPNVQPGRLWMARRRLLKTSQRISLREALGKDCPRFYSLKELADYRVSVSTTTVNCENASDFEFSIDNSEGLIILGDGATVQSRVDKHKLKKEDLYSAFLGMPGVDPSLISQEWFFNHYKWIVWKLASMELHCPQLFGGRSLTPDQVMLQLKYRYDIEIDNCSRSALRKIIEKDDVASKTLVLCVSAIYKEGSSVSLGLTDGWYSLRAELDEPLARLVCKGRIPVGQKLLISGAELVGPADACSPLEIPEGLALKININTTRRASWDLKLGYFRVAQPFRVSLSSLYPRGGAVGRVDCVVIRAYPTMHYEALPNGTGIRRNQRSEHVAAAHHESLRSSVIEKLTAEVLSQVEKSDTEELSAEALSGVQMSFSVKQIQGLTSGQDIWKALKCSADCTKIERILTKEQLRLLNKYQEELLNQKQVAVQNKLQQAIQQAEEEGKCPKQRVVVPVFKALLGGIHEADLCKNVCCILEVWRPTDELRQLLVQGRALSLFHVNVNPSRSALPDVQNCAVELTTSRSTRYEPVECPDHVKIYYSRQVTGFPVLLSENGSLGRAVDIVGFVFLASQQQEADVFYLADSKLNFVQLVVYKQSHALVEQEGAVRPGLFVSATDVVLRPRSRELNKVAVVATTELSQVMCNPQRGHLYDSLTALKALIPDPSSFITVALRHLHTPQPNSTSKAPGSMPRKAPVAEFMPTRLWQPAPHTPSGPKTTPVANCDGLFISGRGNIKPGSPAEGVSQQVRDRIALLERYTALAPIPTLNTPPSKKTKKPFHTPSRGTSPTNGNMAPGDRPRAAMSQTPPMDFDSS